MSEFVQKNEFYVRGNLDKIIENRINKIVPYVEKYGEIKPLDCRKINDTDECWVCKFIYPLSFNKTLLGLINCYEVEVVQEFFIVDGKLYILFKAPSTLAKYFRFEEKVIFEQDGDKIKVTRHCEGKNKIAKWLRYTPFLFHAESWKNDVEKQYQQQQIDYITEEISSSLRD